MFSQTKDLELIKNAFEFCDACVEYAFKDKTPDFNDFKLPVGAPFNQEIEDFGVKTKLHKDYLKKTTLQRIKFLKEQLEIGRITEKDLGVDFNSILKEYNI